MKRLTTSLAVFLLLMHNSSYAKDSNELLRDCNQALKALNSETSQAIDFSAAWRCMAFINGVTVTFSFTRGYYGLSDFAEICLPSDDGLSVSQYVRIATKYMRENPENLFLPPPIAQVVSALKGAYRC